MRKALVVVDPADGVDRITREAGELAAGVGASLVLVHVTSEAEYDDDRRAMEDVLSMEGGSYNVEQAKDGARQFAEDLGKQVLRTIDVEWTSVGLVGNEYEKILQAAADFDCDHVFIAGRKRSPSGKAIFGDTTQQVILNFDDPVTVLTAE